MDDESKSDATAVQRHICSASATGKQQSNAVWVRSALDHKAQLDTGPRGQGVRETQCEELARLLPITCNLICDERGLALFCTEQLHHHTVVAVLEANAVHICTIVRPAGMYVLLHPRSELR